MGARWVTQLFSTVLGQRGAGGRWKALGAAGSSTDVLVSRRETADASPSTEPQRAGTAVPRAGGSHRGAPGPAARRRSAWDRLCCISSRTIQHPELYMGVCVGVRPLSPTEPGENQTLAAVPRAGSAPRISRSGFAKGTATRIACLEQTGCFFLGKPASRVLGWDWSAWAPCRPAALGRA